MSSNGMKRGDRITVIFDNHVFLHQGARGVVDRTEGDGCMVRFRPPHTMLKGSWYVPNVYMEKRGL